ncbi:MAG: T9SS type A sorting domain-containing protein [Bacteroidia bacterium]
MRHLLLLFILFTTTVNAQYTDRYWAFGDSAGIDFKNLANPQPANSVLRVRGSCASICDSAGDLLFYCGSPNWQQWLTPNGIVTDGYVINKNHQTMFSGDSLVGSLWYQEMVIVPMPESDSLFYIFSSGVLGVEGLFYSIVDISFNGGQGKVIQKNVQLSTDSICDGITAVRHGNGRDWWVVVRSWKTYPVNDITVYLISPSGVTAFPTQLIGATTAFDSFNRLKFNLDGNHLYNVTEAGILQRMDFDRCTGILSNLLIYSGLGGPYFRIWGFEVSPDESKLYTTLIYQTANQDTGYILQFDLNAPNFLASVDTLGTYSSYDIPGLLELGPDGKIYVSITYAFPDTCFDYLYCYGTVSMTNSNLSVINSPDSTGAACNFQPFSFNLGGHKTYWGLPNNHNYELGAWVGSPCDTLSVGINEIFPKKGTLKIYYNKEWQSIFVNAEELKGRSGSLQIFNSSGQLIYDTKANIDGGYYSSSSLFSYPSNGVYIVRLQTDKEVLTGKFVKW